jgi:hypothetical protein
LIKSIYNQGLELPRRLVVVNIEPKGINNLVRSGLCKNLFEANWVEVFGVEVIG